MTAAGQLANLLTEHLSIIEKPDLPKVCKRLGLRINEVPLVGADGALVRSKSAQKGIICVRNSLRESTQKRFTIAHEIGHFIIPDHKELGSVCSEHVIDRYGGNVPKAELEANEFAAEFLLPAALVRTPLHLDHPSLENICAVANGFQTSLTATGWRFIDMTDLPCAMIWSTAGKAAWYRKSDALPFNLPLSVIPTARSLAGQLFGQEKVRSRSAKVDPQLWFETDDAERISLLIEDSMLLPNYNAVITLLWAVKLEMPPLSEAEVGLEELDPEQFTLARKRWPR